MNHFSPSPYPEHYPTRDVYKGININNTIPNRYPYMYDRQPFPSLYYEGNYRITPKVFPYTNRPWVDYSIYTKPIKYESLIENLNLIPAYTFYTTNYLV